jgi:hypothetical protein
MVFQSLGGGEELYEENGILCPHEIQNFLIGIENWPENHFLCYLVLLLLNRT